MMCIMLTLFLTDYFELFLFYMNINIVNVMYYFRFFVLLPNGNVLFLIYFYLLPNDY
jgi:hypothetical protein